jgi:hypothetical protein
VQLKTDENNNEYLEFFERATKTKTRTGNTTHHRQFNLKAYAIPDDIVRCPVFAYKQYEMRRPQKTKTAEFPFYTAMLHNRKLDSEYWFNAQALGIHKIQNIMKTMAIEAKLPGRKTSPC